MELPKRQSGIPMTYLIDGKQYIAMAISARGDPRSWSPWLAVGDGRSMRNPAVEIASYSEEELTAMMADLESDIVERKESLRGDAPVKIRQAVCAFANDLPDRRRPGVVLVGVDDGGRAVGGDVSDELLRQLADIKTDGNIVPPPTMVVESRRWPALEWRW